MSWLIIVFTMFQCNCNVNLEDCLANEYNKCEYKASEIYVDCVKERTHCDLLGCDIEFRCDLFVENCLVVELKSVSEIKPIHDAQVLNYMNLLKVPKGIIINFNCFNIFREGQKTFVNEYFKRLEKE